MLKLNKTSRDPTVRPITFLRRYYLLSWNILTFFGKELGEDEIHGTLNRPSSRKPADLAQSAISESQAIGTASIFLHPRVPMRYTILILS